MTLRINNNIQSLNGYRNLNRNDGMLGKSLERLSSGLRINNAADDAAGLVISEQLRAQITGLNRAIANTETAVNMVQSSEGSLDEMNTLLKKVRELSLHAANVAPNDTNQLAADQAELDNAIQSISRIAATTQFGTKKLLDGTLAGANSYDTTKIYKFDVGSALLTRTDYIPGVVSLVVDSSAETSTFITTLAVAVSGQASLISANGTAVTLAGVLDTASWNEFFASGGNTFNGTAVAAGSVGSVVFVARIGDDAYSFPASALTAGSTLDKLNSAQSTYTFVSAASTSGGFKAIANSTGAVGATRDFSFTLKAINSATSISYNAVEFNLTSGNVATVSYGHNQATTIKTSGAATFTGFSVVGGSQGDTTTVFITANGSVVAGTGTMQETLGNGTTRLTTGASMTITVAGKDYSFANNESIADMVSFINNNQEDYVLDSDRDFGLTMVRNKLGTGGDASELRIRVNDAMGRQSTMTALSTTEIEFSGTGVASGGIDRGVNINAHIEGSGLPGGRINLTADTSDASILINNASGVKINVNKAFARQALTASANMTRAALFQVGPNNAQLVGLDIKDMTATKIGLGGDASKTLLNLQSLVDKQALVNGLTTQALDVIDKAITDVTTLRGALGAFQANTLETNLSSLAVTMQNLTSAESTIRDTDFAKESAVFAKNQILVNASTSMLAQANQLPQSVLQLIQGG